MLEQDYLNRPLIENIEYIITNNKVKIQGTDTSWINITRSEWIDKNSLLDTYRNIYRTAKEKGIKVSYKNRFKKFILENWQQYGDEFDYCNKIFDSIIPVAEQVQSRGIHYGYSDDEVLDILGNLKNELGEMFYRSTITSKIREIAFRLDELYSSIKGSGGDAEMTIYL